MARAYSVAVLSMKSTIKALLPQPVLDARRAWIRRRQRQGEKRAFRMTRGRVVAGPFEGLRMVPDAGGIPLAPKLFGTYEQEIHPFLEDSIAAEVDLVVNIGGGEGYYAAGMLMRLPQARAVAFESDSNRRRLIAELVDRNDIEDRVEIVGHCDSSSLRAALDASLHALILCDIEGGERELIDPELVPELRRCDAIVELHDFLVPGIGETLRERFRCHRIDSVSTRPRTVADVPSSPRWRPEQVVPLLSERRPCEMQWMRLRCNPAGS